MDRLELELAHARRSRDPLALLFLDLDDFKEVNDRFGHHAGDALLRSVARRLQECLREGDTVARLGGDEFTVVLPAISGAGGAARVAEKILDALARPEPYEGIELRTGVSIGIALYPDHVSHGGAAADLLRRADEAMYRAKELGGGRASFPSDLEAAARS